MEPGKPKAMNATPGKAERILVLVARRLFRCVDSTQGKFRLALLCTAFAGPFEPRRHVRRIRLGGLAEQESNRLHNDPAGPPAYPGPDRLFEAVYCIRQRVLDLPRSLDDFRLSHLDLLLFKWLSVEDFFQVINFQRETLTHLRVTSVRAKAGKQDIPLPSLPHLRHLFLAGTPPMARLLPMITPSLRSLALRRSQEFPFDHQPGLAYARLISTVPLVADALNKAANFHRLNIRLGKLSIPYLDSLWEAFDQSSKDRLAKGLSLREAVQVEGSDPVGVFPVAYDAWPTLPISPYVCSDRLRSLTWNLNFMDSWITVEHASSLATSLHTAHVLADLTIKAFGSDAQLVSFFGSWATLAELSHLRRLRLHFGRCLSDRDGEPNAATLTLPAGLVHLKLAELWPRDGNENSLPLINAFVDGQEPPLALSICHNDGQSNLRSLCIQGLPHYVSPLLTMVADLERLEWRCRCLVDAEVVENHDKLAPHTSKRARREASGLPPLPPLAFVLLFRKCFVHSAGESVGEQWRRWERAMMARLAADLETHARRAHHAAPRH